VNLTRLTRRRRFPHALTLLVACIVAATILTYVVPAGQYDRRDDPATGRSVVVAGTYHAVAPDPVGPLEMLVAIPRGMAAAADVIFLVFLVGGAFAVVERTGALAAGLNALLRRLGHREALIIPICCIAFAAGGALQNMQEEIIALVPLLVLLVDRLGYDRMTAAAMSIGAAAVGSAFSPVNPFQVGIAQKLAEVPLLSGGIFRTVFLVLALAIWIWGTHRHASRNRQRPPTGDEGAVREEATRAALGEPAAGDAAARRAPAAGDAAARGEPAADHAAAHAAGGDRSLSGARTALILGLVLSAFAAFIIGLSRFGWGFDQMSAVFFAMGVAAGLLGRLGIDGTAEAYIEGFRSMAFAALLIGFARAIFVVLDDGLIIDSVVHTLFAPIDGLPRPLAVVGMMGVQTLIHVPVPSVSGQAVLTLPILVPLSDLLDIARQVTILAYQYGAGLCELLTPTNGALMAIIAAAGVEYDRWIRFVFPLWLALSALGVVAIVIALAIGLQ
jgi:uncharacterized ion transporter superfamily protein YfcC